MPVDDHLLNRLGTYFIHFELHERFGFTFEEYVKRYMHDASTCSVDQLTKKAATIALVTA